MSNGHNCNDIVTKEYNRLRSKDWIASAAFRAASIHARFTQYEGKFVKLSCEPEIDWYDDSYIDSWDCSEQEKKRFKKELADRIEREGHWILAAYCRVDESNRWEMVDSVGGFIGDDFIDSGYDVDLKRAALKELNNRWEEAAKELSKRATYAGITL